MPAYNHCISNLISHIFYDQVIPCDFFPALDSLSQHIRTFMMWHCLGIECYQHRTADMQSLAEQHHKLIAVKIHIMSIQWLSLTWAGNIQTWYSKNSPVKPKFISCTCNVNCSCIDCILQLMRNLSQIPFDNSFLLRICICLLKLVHKYVHAANTFLPF